MGGKLGLSLTFIKDEVKIEIKFLHSSCVSNRDLLAWFLLGREGLANRRAQLRW